ncbi:DNA repair ATPase [Saccharothrix texasensis]|uniref:DNA repair ATPase n=1 Tax=Saccharothrix texasensis TaxID=103734 RepID=UPI000F4BE0F7|nr:DNA repair ATPase [Saccharothrix texasensis]
MSTPVEVAPATLEAGTYEVLRARLAEQAAGLARRAEALNARRLDAFGGAELTLLGTERIRTEHNCVPRDCVSLSVAEGRGSQVAGLMLFGYNVFIGLKPETTVDDVFSLHRFTRDGDAFRFEDAGSGDPADDELPGLLRDAKFERDFAELYRYYRDTRLIQLRKVEGRLLAVFQTGARIGDIRVLRWQLGADGTVAYLDNRGERDHVFPPSHDFEWVVTGREHHVLGRHPHISIEDEVFVETIGGDLTIKVENNTETGEGVYTEPVDEPLQSLADGEVQYARVGSLILLRIRPYNETAWRHLVFNTRTRAVVRLDGIGQACQRLPEEQGLIFPGGYYLATGVSKTFDTPVDELEFERVIRSTNGEDVLYVFHARRDGRSLLLPYNVIRKEVANPLTCHGYSLFDDGTLVVFRAMSDEPTRVHPMQVWQTPYLSDAYAAAQPVGTGPLERVGNADLVRGISDCLSVSRMVGEMAPSVPVFEDLISSCTRVFDAYHWLGDAELEDLRTPLTQVRATAEQVLDEFETVQALTDQAATAVAEADERIASMIRRVRGEVPTTADAWVRQLADLRQAQGHLVTLKDLRYVDAARIDALVSSLADELGGTARRAVEHLRRDDAFADYHEQVEALVGAADAIGTVAEAGPVVEELAERQRGLEVLTEVVGSLDIADATVRTSILERIGEVLGGLNRARATVDGRRRALLATEGRAEFAAEFALLGQAITGALAVADTPQRCDEQLGRLLLQLENLESRFGEFDDFLTRLGDKRTDVYEAFSSRKQALLDDRARRADRLASSADRILAGVTGRVASLASLDEVNTYFATDPMVVKVRSVAEQLRSLGDEVRAEELDGRVLAARQEAGRSLRDRLDLFDGGTIRLGRHRFAVNTQPVDLTLVPKDGEPVFAIIGTDFRSPVRDPAFADTRPFWDQLLVSETAEVYRAEHLATSILAGHPLDDLHAAVTEDRLPDLVRQVAESRLDEGYERGVHDHDAARILDVVLRLHAGAGVLRYPPSARAAAQLFWASADEDERALFERRASSLGRARAAFGHTAAIDELCAELAAAAGDPLAGEYLFEELCSAPFGFATSAGARALVDAFHRALGGRKEFDEDLRAVVDLDVRRRLVEGWYEAFLGGLPEKDRYLPDLPEAVALELCRDLPRHESSAQLTATADGLLGAHPRIADRSLPVRLDELLTRTRRFRDERVPAYRAYQRRRNEVVAAERARLRLDEFQPKVMSAFVRNRLLDEVYLPLIGDNLAKQLGAAGDGKRTDQMGLLLLISPPGYGKTTVMEYVANRLGLVFVKVNGPSLGHDVTSVDPADAPNATARQEVEKISFALEAGNNVLLYLDDIQHTSPELLQKFISLCDAQRRMEGVWDGGTRTYDLRGKRFAVCMAGNPYTESGQRFRIPDMLANRADVWNLGDVLSGREDLFALSYIENALTSNPVLAPLSTRDRGDVELLVRMARGEDVRADRLAHPYSSVELEQVLSVLRKLLRVQEVVLANNQAYIASAAQADASRVEPPFQLQGSYRNMNKLAEKVVPVMNDAELAAVIDDHYAGEAQTLTSGAEANLLKLAELRGALTPAAAARWAEVKAAYVRAQALGGATDDPTTRTVGALSLLTDRVGAALDRLADR